MEPEAGSQVAPRCRSPEAWAAEVALHGSPGLVASIRQAGMLGQALMAPAVGHFMVGQVDLADPEAAAAPTDITEVEACPSPAA